MNKIGLHFFVSALLAMPVYGFEFEQAHVTKAQALMAAGENDQLGYQLVESLTTEIGPRLAGTDAEMRARTWAVKKLEGLGFENVHIEEFDVPVWLRGIEHAEIVSPFPQQLHVTALGGSVATPEAGVSGEVVKFTSVAALQKAEAGSMAEKIIFIDEVMARTQDGSGYGAAVAKRRLTAYEAHRVGASAALIRSVGTSTHRFAHTGQMKRVTDINPGPSVPTAALSAPDADQLARMLQKNKSVRLHLTLTPKLMPASKSGNVIAEIPGKTDDIVLLGAHLDSWDLGTGAVDDGAGVGIVVAAAKLVKQFTKQPPQKTVRIVLFGSEEVGLVGAKAYAEKHKDTLIHHVIAVESDFGADVIWRMGSKNVADQKLPIIKALQRIFHAQKVVPGDNQSGGGPDLKYLREAGVPVIDFRQNGRDYFDLHHTANDTFDKIDLNKMQQNIAVYAAFTYLVANMDENFRAE